MRCVADFLLELLTEEIPARMQAKAAADLGRLFAEAMAARGVAGVTEVHVTPRRLALIARGLPAATQATREERRGPRADAPEGAILGFCKGAGVAREALDARDDPKGRFLYASIERPGRALADVLAEAVPEAVGKLGWPKSMRWGAASVAMDSPRWVRPLSGVVALLDGAVVPMTILGMAPGRVTRGHRFMHSGPIEIASAATYEAQLRAAHVILNVAERRRLIEEGARAAAAAAGLVLMEDAGLVAENAGLTEWPVPLLGRFDPDFLDVPREVIQLTMRTNQKYFACTDVGGALAPAFVCVANIVAADGGTGIVEGNRRVLAARLSDARFFWEQDRARGLDAMLPALERVVFHEKLGTMRDKAERVARLARWLAAEAVPGADPALAERAGRLAKADLVSAMVGEFPELQGVMGGYYAAASGEAAEVAAAVRDHYRPVGPGDFVPTEPVSVAVALADKLDTLFSFFEIEEFPTGSRDPYGLRRAALGVIRLLQDNEVKLLIGAAAEHWIGQSEPRPLTPVEIGRRFIMTTVTEFLLDRLEVQLRELGIAPGLVAASRNWNSAGDGRLDRVRFRSQSLSLFVGTEDGASLLAAYKRAANILGIEAKRDGVERFGAASALPLPAADAAVPPPVRGRVDQAARPPSPEPGEGQREAQGEGGLGAILPTVSAEATAAIAAEDFTAAMAALARLRAPIDAFFAATLVNDPDPAIRHANLALLQRFVDAVHAVADFSRIEG